MSFDRRDIRTAMDVYTRDNVYLGTVLAVIPGPQDRAGEPVAAGARQTSAVNGELLGPMPTQTIGNPGPSTQSAHALYAVEPDSAQPLGKGALVAGKWWGLIGRRTIPLDDVQSVSLERVILKQRQDEIAGSKS
jgi:hypothetical protein